MTRRLTETEKWRDKWFRKLPKDAKLLFLWLCDNVDHAGFIELDAEQIEWETGLSEEESNLALITLSEGNLPKGKGKLGYLRVIIRDGYCWIRNRVKIQCGSTNLRTNVRFEKGCVKRFLEHQEAFPEPLGVYTVNDSVSYPNLASLSLHKNKNKNKNKNKEQEGGSGGSPAAHVDDAEIRQWKGKDEHYDELIAGGVQIGFDEFMVIKARVKDVDYDKVIDTMLASHVKGKLSSPGGYMLALVRSPDFKLSVEDGGVDESGHTAAWVQQQGDINSLYTDKLISADGVREMHRQHHEGVEFDIAEYRRGEGALQAEFPMAVAE